LRRTVIAEENSGKIIEMHRLARGIEIREHNFFDTFFENQTSRVRRVIETDKKVLPISPSVFPNNNIYHHPVDD
jgi:hypothetical protein